MPAFPPRLDAFLDLTRLNKPIGIFLLLWPTLWALFLAAESWPSVGNIIIFTLGVIAMRSAGCVINDFADRKIDGHVSRTQNRPIPSGRVSANEALIVFGALSSLAFLLVLLTNTLTIYLSLAGACLAVIYPFMKRYTQMPQVFLGAAFAWAIPMAFAAQSGELSKGMWLIYIAVVLWTVCYDTFYAMVDREDDLKIGVKSTAILFGENDRKITAVLQFLVIANLAIIGKEFELGGLYSTSLLIVIGLFIYQQHLLSKRQPDAYFKAFLNNNWVGLIILIGIIADKLLKN